MNENVKEYLAVCGMGSLLVLIAFICMALNAAVITHFL